MKGRLEIVLHTMDIHHMVMMIVMKNNLHSLEMRRWQEDDAGQMPKFPRVMPTCEEYVGNTNCVQGLAPQNCCCYRGTSLIRNSGRLGPYSRTIPRALWQS